MIIYKKHLICIASQRWNNNYDITTFAATRIIIYNINALSKNYHSYNIVYFYNGWYGNPIRCSGENFQSVHTVWSMFTVGLKTAKVCYYQSISSQIWIFKRFNIELISHLGRGIVLEAHVGDQLYAAGTAV